MLAEQTGEVPAVSGYEGERARRIADGERWPTHSTLIAHYGEWVRAVRAAMILVAEGSAGCVPASTKHYGWREATSPGEVVAAISECRETLGHWPTEGEYLEYRRLRRALARAAGKLESVRLPSRHPITKLYGDYEAALRAARARSLGSSSRGARDALRSAERTLGVVMGVRNDYSINDVAKATIGEEWAQRYPEVLLGPGGITHAA